VDGSLEEGTPGVPPQGRRRYSSQPRLVEPAGITPTPWRAAI
jgi:hypothetical protein